MVTMAGFADPNFDVLETKIEALKYLENQRVFIRGSHDNGRFDKPLTLAKASSHPSSPSVVPYVHSSL
jgi:hypothetical protein